MTDFRDQQVAAEVDKKILQEIADRRRQIATLLSEIDAYEKMLIKSREQQALISRTDVTRKNSIKRILIENSVINTLKASGRPRGTHTLYMDATLIVGSLKQGTFRTILHRMKGRELIISVGEGKWQIGPAAHVTPKESAP
ncbi:MULTISPECIES: hypothetical protein [unclassified Bradyrhizobium]|uniref:hypothetical protein n=1 Tax=unclassified Bradyrhizobium TaxID=2631580 RepID=UPI0029167CEC|nr:MULTISPECIES: hypothetical protein [unclassified Bradyrhizobium]